MFNHQNGEVSFSFQLQVYPLRKGVRLLPEIKDIKLFKLLVKFSFA